MREIGDRAFCYCFNLSNVEFGDKLETIGRDAFYSCLRLTSIKSLSVRTIGRNAFTQCQQLEDVEFGSGLEAIDGYPFGNCHRLQRIVLPLKDNLFSIDPYNHRCDQFDDCHNLATVDIVGAVAINKTIISLLLETWRDNMFQVIDRINRQLPRTHPYDKAETIRQWIRSVINRMNHYKAEHKGLLKEHMTLLELAVWKAKIDEKKDNFLQKLQAKRAKIDEESSRKEKCITSGADIIIKNVLPFLKLA